jgi:hypothetical protein
MTLLRNIAVAAVLSALTATPVFAQAAIQEPGMFAFYHPNLDVLNGGAPTPAARQAARRLDQARLSPQQQHRHHRVR